jgi:two-component system sensor histidine kinase AtoS
LPKARTAFITMKRKILIIVTVFSLVGAAGGALLLLSINHLTSNLNELILLHRVEIQREQLLLNIQKVQVGLYSQTTTHPESTEVMMELVNRMGVAIANCFHCHHEERVKEALLDLQEQIGQFDEQFTRALAARLDVKRFERERQRANIIGDSLISKLSTMIKLTEERLSERSTRSQRDMWLSELIVLGLVILGPLMVAVFGFKTLSGFANPIRALLVATKHLKAGELDHTVSGLKDEFAELASAFNEMARSLQHRLKEVSENESRYRLLFESAGDAIFILDAEGENAGRIVSANRAAAAMHGYSVEELLSMNIRDVDAPDAAAKFVERIEQALKGDWITAQIEHVKKDGTVFPVEISAGMFEFNDHKYILAIDRDLTERHRAAEMLQRTIHLRAVGELAAGLAHEIKNPLAGIKITMETLAEESSLAPDDRKVLSRVVGEINRIDVLIRGLLNFARPPKPHFMPVDVNAVLDGAAQLVMQDRVQVDGVSRTIDVVRNFEPDLPEIIADPMQLRQVFMNLLINAVDSMPEGGSLTMNTRCDAASRVMHVSISDTGQGMSAEVRDRVFQPFYTTKAGGTGLGLAISKRLIEEHGGWISVDSSAGRGTKFTVTIPCERGKDADRDER